MRSLLELIWYKAILNLKAETERAYLSYIWWILEPMLHLGVYLIVFSLILKHHEENYIVFLMTGLIPWMWFSKCISSSSNSIISNHNLIMNFNVPPIVYPIISILQSSIKQAPSFLILIGLLWGNGFNPSPIWLTIILLIVIQIMLTVLIGCVVAALVPFARDINHIVPTGLSFMMFLSGVFYSHTQVPSEWQKLFLANPMAFILKSYREVLVEGTFPDVFDLSLWFFILIVGLVILVLTYDKLRHAFPRRICS